MNTRSHWLAGLALMTALSLAACGGTVSISGGTYSGLGTVFTATATCPASATVTLHYTAWPTGFTLFEDAQKRITVYEKL